MGKWARPYSIPFKKEKKGKEALALYTHTYTLTTYSLCRNLQAEC